jgi:hypothetical protein
MKTGLPIRRGSKTIKIVNDKEPPRRISGLKILLELFDQCGVDVLHLVTIFFRGVGSHDHPYAGPHSLSLDGDEHLGDARIDSLRDCPTIFRLEAEHLLLNQEVGQVGVELINVVPDFLVHERDCEGPMMNGGACDVWCAVAYFWVRQDISSFRHRKFNRVWPVKQKG